jgi:hypothetical protein
MDRQKQLRNIKLDLDTLQAHINRLKKKKNDIHQLDVDLLLENTRKLYDKILGLNTSENEDRRSIVLPETMPEAEIPEVAFSTQGIGPGPLVVEEKIEPELKDGKETNVKAKTETDGKEGTETKKEAAEESPDTKMEAEEKPQVKEEEDKKVSKEKTEDKKPQQLDEEITETPDSERAAEKDEKKSTQARSAFDLFSSSAEETVADKLGKNEDASLAEKIEKSQIADLRQAIGINEKFLFINELFNGDLGRYNKAIDEFNELKSQQGVDTYLLEMKIQNQWPDDIEAYIKLKALLDRKFG